MRIVAEYDIKLSREADPVVLYKLPRMERNLRIEAIRRKPQSKYLEMDMRLPRMGQGSSREDRGPGTITYESHGFSPLPRQWYGKIDHSSGVIVLRPVECIHLFSPKFGNAESSSREVDGYQVRRAETREEKEHRKKNINFHIKRMNLEESVALEYKKKEMALEYTDAPRAHAAEQNIVSAAKIKRSIVNAKVVNFSELVLLYGDEDVIKAALSRYTRFVHGRYILSNMFYERGLHRIRDNILRLFERKERILAKDLYDAAEGEDFLAEELCRKVGGYFCLRGAMEYANECGTRSLGEGIASVVERLQPCSLEAVREEMLLEPDEIRQNLPGNVTMLANGMLVICGGSERRRKIIEMLVTKKTWKKVEVLRVAQDDPQGIENFFDAFGEYCELKGSTWNIKE